MANEGYFKRVARMTPTRLWVNNVTAEEARSAIVAGAVGATQNPSYAARLFAIQSPECAEAAARLAGEIQNDDALVARLQTDMVGLVAKEFQPLHAASAGLRGFVTVQGDPFRENTADILDQAEMARSRGPNVMPKIPVVAGAMEAIAKLAEHGVPLCCTEVFALSQAVDVCETILHATDNKPKPVVCLAHIAGIYDEYLAGYVRENNINIASDVLWHAGIAVAKKIYEVVRERRYPVEFLGGGARGTHHFTEMVGAEASVTLNWTGMADKLEEENPVVVQRFRMPTPASVIDELADKLPDFRKGYFAKALPQEEYESFGPVALFRSKFEQGWKEAAAKVAEIRKGLS